MKLIGWVIAGISAVTATTLGIVSFGAGSNSGNNFLTSPYSAASESNVHTATANSLGQSTVNNHGLPISGSNSLTRLRSKPKTINERLDDYSKCRKYSIRKKCISLVPEGSRMREFLL